VTPAVCAAVILAVAASCANGSESGDAGATCDPPMTDCAGNCVDITADPANCGGCGKKCTGNEVCSNGQCNPPCPSGQRYCKGEAGAGSCVTTTSDDANCGGCGKVCPAGQFCANGACSNGCGQGQTRCTPEAGAAYCASLKTDQANCGACGATCGAAQVCAGGTCASTCAASQMMCTSDAGGPAYCADLQTDNANCGDCGTTCGVLEICENGACASACAPDQTACGVDGGMPYCASTATDNANCGGCGTTCKASEVCIAGLCTQLGTTCTGVVFSPSYAASSTFADFNDTFTVMTLAFDGTDMWVSHGGSAADMNEGQYDSNYTLLQRFQPNLDLRSFFTIGTTLYARPFSNSSLYKQTAPGSFTPAVTLTGGTLDSQAAVVYDPNTATFVENDYGTVYTWNAGGSLVKSIPLVGWGQNSENSYPQGRGVAVARGCYLTYSGAGILSAWSDTGVRLATTTLTGAGVSFDSYFSLSYARGLVWVVDKVAGTWRGYNVGL
jgi:hypothetical protein